MKKVLVLAAAAFCSTLTFAQKKSATAPISFGVKAGINLANFSGDGTDGYSSKIGVNGGVTAAFKVSKSFAIQPELGWSTLGGKVKDVPYVDGNLNSQTGTAKLPLGYLALPVLAKYTIGTSGISVYAGPQLSYLLSAKIKLGGNSTDIKDNFKKTDFAGVGGVQYEIPKTNLNVSARYQLGLSNILKDNSDGSWKNKAFTFTVGYRFN